MFEEADLLRLIDGDCSPEEAAAIQAWIAADPRRGTLLDELRAVWRLTGDTTRGWDTRPAVELVAPRRRWWTTFPPWAMQVAVLAAVLLGSSLFWHFSRSGGSSVYATARGQVFSLALPDGSRVLLGVDSRLRVPRNFGSSTRMVELEGEAYFVVEYDAERPFTVRTKYGSTQDLGTEFAVRAYRQDASLEVVVAEGRVLLRGEKRVEPALVMLHPHERAVLDSGGRATITRDVPLESYLGWTRGALLFDDAPLSRVITQLERWYDLEIETDDAALAGERVTISFMTKSANEAVNALAQVLNVRATRTGRLVHLEPVRPRR